MTDLPFTKNMYASKFGKKIGQATYDYLLRHGKLSSDISNNSPKPKSDFAIHCVFMMTGKQLFTTLQGLWRVVLIVSIGMISSSILFGPDAFLMFVAVFCLAGSWMWYTFAGALHLGYIEGQTSEAAEQQLRRLCDEI